MASNLSGKDSISDFSAKTLMYLDNHFGRIEEQLHTLRDVPRQLAAILDVVTWLEGSLSDSLQVSDRPLLQSSALSRNLLMGRLRRRHHSASSQSPKSNDSPSGSSVVDSLPPHLRRRRPTNQSQASSLDHRGLNSRRTSLMPVTVLQKHSPRPTLKKALSSESLGAHSEISDSHFSGPGSDQYMHAQTDPLSVSKRPSQVSALSAISPEHMRLPDFSLSRRASTVSKLSDAMVVKRGSQRKPTNFSDSLMTKRPSHIKEPPVPEANAMEATFTRSDRRSQTVPAPQLDCGNYAEPNTPPGYANKTEPEKTLHRIDNPRGMALGMGARDSNETVESRPTLSRKCSRFQLATDTQAIPAYICMAFPQHRLRLTWDACNVVIATMVSFIVPMKLVYLDSGFINDRDLAIILLLTDAMWLIDSAVNFRTGAFVHGTLVMDPRRIAAHYGKRWLALDLLVSFPTALLQQGTPLCSIMQMLKLLRLLKFFLMISRLQKGVRSSALLPAKLLLGVSLPTHLIACMWRAVIWADTANADKSEHWRDLYIKDMYWVFMTMTTIGYGDIHPTGNRTRVFAIFVMLIASVFYGAIITTLSHISSKFLKDEVEDRITAATRIMNRRHVPRSLQQRVVINLRHQLHNSHRSPAELFLQLSPALQRELSLAFLSKTVMRFPLFMSIQHSFVAELAQAHLWVECFPNDLIAEPGQIVQELVFVVHGRLIAFCPPNADLDMTYEDAIAAKLLNDGEDNASEEQEDWEKRDNDVELVAGAWFGEACLFNDGGSVRRIRLATVMSVVDSELAVLTAKEYHRVVNMFPDLVRRHQALQRSLRDGSKTLKELAYKSPPPLYTKNPQHKFSTLLPWKTKDFSDLADLCSSD